MTKREKAIINEEVKRTWEAYKDCKELYGKDHPTTKAMLEAWTTVQYLQARLEGYCK
jgi:cation transport regulator ChaB